MIPFSIKKKSLPPIDDYVLEYIDSLYEYYDYDDDEDYCPGCGIRYFLGSSHNIKNCFLQYFVPKFFVGESIGLDLVEFAKKAQIQYKLETVTKDSVFIEFR